MARWKEDLHDLCEKVSDEISEANKKLEKSGGKMTAGDLDYIDKLTHTMKSIKTVLAMVEYDDNEYSGARGGNRGGNRGGSNRGGYSRGFMPYYGSSYEGGRMMGGNYSRDDAKADMMEQLRDLEMSAPDERTKRMVREWMKQVDRD